MATPKIVSALAPDAFPDMPVIPGVALAGGAVGIRYKKRSDVMLAVLDEGTSVAGCYTRSLTASAPVDWCKAAQTKGRVRAIVVNSGNANAFTGAAGVASVEREVAATAHLVGCKKHEVFVASTGVIGEPLADDKIVAGLPGLIKSAKPTGWFAAAQAIMTTDTFAKGATATALIDGVPVTVNGFAKGSGMIAPDMATMLAFVFTDAAISPDVLQHELTRATDRSFNCITVDSDTSTSDTLILCATHKAAHRPIKDRKDVRVKAFRRALEAVLTDLAKQVVKDGEGAEKFITIRVTGAATDKAARRIGLAIANSPLVKTAIAGEDANWGRIVMAVGKSGEKADRDRLMIKIGGVIVAADGQRVDGFDETPVAAHIKTRDIAIEVDVAIGKGDATVWTCDLTHRYLDINAGYRS
jgi:glutamate N-acetyltransferase/amino-acid N-acetyltransferase